MNARIMISISDADVRSLATVPGNLLREESATVGMHLGDGSEVRIDAGALLRAMGVLKADRLLSDRVKFEIGKAADPSSVEMPVFDREIEADAAPCHLLHRLWTKAVGTPGYVKNEWKRLEKLLQERTT